MKLSCCKRILPLLILIFLCVFAAASVPASATPYGDFAHAEGDALVTRTNGTVIEQAQSGPYTYIAPAGYALAPTILLDTGECATYTLTLSNGTVIQGNVSVSQIGLELPAPFGLRGTMILGDDTDHEAFYNLFGKIEFITAYTTTRTNTGHIIMFITNNNQLRGIPNENTPIVSYRIDDMQDTYIQSIYVVPDGQYTVDYAMCIIPLHDYAQNVYSTQHTSNFDYIFSDIVDGISGLLDTASMSISFVVELFSVFKLIVMDNFAWLILCYEATALALSFTRSRDIWDAASRYIKYNTKMLEWLMRIAYTVVHAITSLANAIKLI